MKKKNIADLRMLLAESMKDKRPGVDAEATLDRLERKYFLKAEKRATPR